MKGKEKDHQGLEVCTMEEAEKTKQASEAIDDVLDEITKIRDSRKIMQAPLNNSQTKLDTTLANLDQAMAA